MRRAIAFILAGVAMFGGAAMAWVRHRLRGIPKPVVGIFSNGMAYARLGTGSRTALAIRGGPGNVVPMGRLFLASSVSLLRPFLDSGYTMWLVTRKRNMPEGYRIEDMAEDYATLIAASTVIIPVVVFLVAGDRMGDALAAAKDWLINNNSVVMAVLLLVIGVSLIGDAIEILF